MIIKFRKIDICRGICQNLFGELKLKSSYMQGINRNCILIFDEMVIKKCLNFHPKKQIIESFRNLGSLGRNSAVGTQVLVFMLRVLFTNWKHSLVFFIIKSSIIKDELSIILDQILDALDETSSKVRTVVSNQSTSNQSFATEPVSINEPFFIKNNKKIYYLIDYLHLFESIRNNLLKSDFSINNSPVLWQDVILLWNLENNKNIRAAYRLSEKHLNSNNFDKMKCKLTL